MPSKFSHSVVLAHYSSLGLIDLPNSQHVAYLNSCSPSTSETLTAASRTQSDLKKASYNGDVKKNIKPSPVHSQPQRASPLAHPIDSPLTTRTRGIINTVVRPENAPHKCCPNGCDKVSSTSMGHNDGQSAQRNSNQFGIQPTSTSGPDSEGSVVDRPNSGMARTETCSSSGIFAASFSKTSSERSLKAPQRTSSSINFADNASEQHSDTSPSQPQGLKQACPTHTLQSTKSHQWRYSSPVEPAIAALLPAGKSLRPEQPSRNASSYTSESRKVRPFSEALNFEGVSGLNEPNETQKTDIAKTGLTLKAEPSPISDWFPEAHLAYLQRLQNNNQRQRSPSPHPNIPNTVTSPPVLPENFELSIYNSLNSFSELDCLEIPIMERAHPLRLNKGVLSSSAPTPGTARHLVSPKDDKVDGYSPNLFELGSPPRDETAAKPLDCGNLKSTLRQSLDCEQDLEAATESFLEVGADFKPDIVMYEVKNAVGSPLAPVEMLQKREEEANLKDGDLDENIGLNNKDKIKQAEETLRELKKSTVPGNEVANSHKRANAKLKKNEVHRFIQRLRGQR